MSASALRILQLIDSLDVGGAEAMAVRLANDLPQDRFDSHLGTTRRDGVLASNVAPHVRRLRLERQGRFDLAAVRRFRHYVESEGIDVIHAHSTAVFFALLGAGPRPIVWHLHGRPAGRRVPTWLHRLAGRRLAATIAVSEPLARWAREGLGLPTGQVLEVANGVEVAAFNASQGTEASRFRTLDLPGVRSQRIVSVANLRPEKDHHTLLGAFAQLLHYHPSAQLLLVGSEPDRDLGARLRARSVGLGIASSVHFLGPRQDIADILASSSVGVLSSRSEGLPLALLEYGAASLAVVATTVGQCPEVLDHGRAGLLVEPQDESGLAKALSALLEDASARDAFGSALRTRVATSYNAQQAVQAIADLYSTLVPSR